MASRRHYVEDLSKVFVGEIVLSNGKIEYTRPYSTKGAARGQITYNLRDRDLFYDGKPLYNPHVVSTRVLVPTGWEEAK